jgi:NAD+ kinase
MRFAKNAALFGKPVVGVNAGRLGYLADIEENELSLLKMIPEGKCSIENRMMLKVLFEDENGTHSEHHCINDAVISRTSESRVIDIYVDLYGERFNYRADGLIFSTATGSTAYSLSVGGPIMMPENHNLIIAPVASHSLNVRPLIIPDNWKIDLAIHSRSHSYLASIDGRSITMPDTASISISKADYTVRIIRLEGHSFLNTLKTKLMWGADVRS